MCVNKRKRVFVWYTPEIPLPYGPSLYNGLPGLVLEVHWGKIVFKTTKIIVNPTQEIKILKPKKGIKINEKEYYKKGTEIG
jgi:GLPGLI family protein